VTSEEEAAAQRRHRAEDAVHRIAGGENAGALSLRLANEFTDALTARMSRLLRGKRPDAPKGDPRA
jgi:hypothetical protein